MLPCLVSPEECSLLQGEASSSYFFSFSFVVCFFLPFLCLFASYSSLTFRLYEKLTVTNWCFFLLLRKIDWFLLTKKITIAVQGAVKLVFFLRQTKRCPRLRKIILWWDLKSDFLETKSKAETKTWKWYWIFGCSRNPHISDRVFKTIFLHISESFNFFPKLEYKDQIISFKVLFKCFEFPHF